MARSDFARIERAIRYLDEHVTEQPSLADVARAAGLSEFHFQRLFTRWAGISPKRFLQYATATYARSLLQQSRSALESSLTAGLSGPGRLHDLVVNVEAVTPGELRSGGEGVEIRHGVEDSPLGPMLVAQTARGICGLSFIADQPVDAALSDLLRRWPRADLVKDSTVAREAAKAIFGADRSKVSLHLRGTNFQLRVWDALLRIPEGAVKTYGTLARELGDPKASRAVGSAVGANPIAVLIPCHRVIRETGAFGGYRWGEVRKRALLAFEAARLTAPERAAPAASSGS